VSLFFRSNLSWTCYYNHPCHTTYYYLSCHGGTQRRFLQFGCRRPGWAYYYSVTPVIEVHRDY